MCFMKALMALIRMPFFSLHYGKMHNGNLFSALYQMLLDIISDNLFTPFTNSNTLQIMFAGIVVASQC